MSTSERKEEIASCSSRIQTMTSRITELERDINRARATKDYVSCSNLHGQQRKMNKDLNGLKNKLANLQKKEIKHQKYMAKRSDEDKSKTSSSDYGDVVQKDIRHFLQKKEGTSSCSITCLNAEEKMHGPQSDDTMILSSDEENSGQTEDEDWIDTTRVQSWTEDVERPASVSKKGMIDSMGRRNQLEDKDESEAKKENKT